MTPAQDAGSNNPPAGTVKVGSNSATFTLTFSNTARLTSSPLDVAQGSIVIAGVAMGALANMHAPTDSRGSAYSALTQPRNYTGWLQSGMQLFSASNLPATPSLVVGEDMGAAPNDEVTLSVVEVRGGSRIVGVAEAEHPGSSPVQSGTVTTTGPALLVSWWWGDGGNSQITATPSAGWTRLHALSRAQGMSGFIQVEVATRYVAQAGSYSVAWTADPDQGAVVQIVAVQ